MPHLTGLATSSVLQVRLCSDQVALVVQGETSTTRRVNSAIQVEILPDGKNFLLKGK